MQLSRFCFATSNGRPRLVQYAAMVAARAARGGDEIAAIDHAPERFVDRISRIGSRELAEDVAIALARADRRGERAIELAVEKEFPVLRVEADDVRRQHIDAEIRRELRNVLAVLQCDRFAAKGGHEVSVHGSSLLGSSRTGVMYHAAARERSRVPERLTEQVAPYYILFGIARGLRQQTRRRSGRSLTMAACRSQRNLSAAISSGSPSNDGSPSNARSRSGAHTTTPSSRR